MPDVADDPDLAHLFELLGMLSGPRENLRFWEVVAEHARASSVHYVFEKLSGICRTARESTPEGPRIA